MPDKDEARNVDQRIDELEIRHEFQTRNVEDLDGVVREFAGRVAKLEAELHQLRVDLEALTSGGPAPAANDEGST